MKITDNEAEVLANAVCILAGISAGTEVSDKVIVDVARPGDE